MNRLETNNRQFQDGVRQSLSELGIREYNLQEIVEIYRSFRDDLSHAIISPENCIEYGFPGLVNTGIELINPGEWGKVKPGKAIACAFAGTNWIVSLVEKQLDGSLTIRDLDKTDMTKLNKTHTPETLSRLMAETIDKASIKANIDPSSIDAIGVACGFAQDNIRTSGGIDARFTRHSDAKGWHFLDFQSELPAPLRPSLGHSLIATLPQMSGGLWRVQHFAFRNDTHGVAEHGQTWGNFTLPIGLVFGTGDNGSCLDINTELGERPVNPDPILYRMAEMGLLPDQTFIAEYLMGGDYIKYRVACGMMLLEERGMISQGKIVGKKILETDSKTIVSDLAKGSQLVSNVLGFEPEKDVQHVLQMTAAVTLNQAGMHMGNIMAALADVAGYDGSTFAAIPVEGNVLLHGYGVRQSANSAMKTILPQHNLYIEEASGMVGVGAVALAQTIQT